MMSTEEQMLISAVRYALGRQSYIVGTTCKFVASIREKLSTKCLNIIVCDISEEIDMYHRIGHTCGMECDERTWKNLLSVLKFEVNERNEKCNN